ncbi:helix-turn-helix domain-containing protein [Nocardioides sp. 503]|uniref:helix-turn-helix domain-containing protein n=1 Tax=Nocardioides sp. 503 TaxID=2508326 RepID=UPI00106F709D|nr:helix-turn-helix domain-containing protein [Nocardioides sp. 503]
MTHPSRKAAPANDGPLFFTLKSAAALCDVSVDVLQEAVKAGRLRGKRTGTNGGGLYLFSRAQLEAWFEDLVDA